MSGLVGYGNIPVKITTGYDTIDIKEFKFDNSGNLQLPQGGNVLDHLGNIIISEGYTTGDIRFDNDIIYNVDDSSPIILRTVGVDSVQHNFLFDIDGSFSCNKIIQGVSSTSNLITFIEATPTPTVIWSTSFSSASSKLLIQVEQQFPGGFHTHTCEAIISRRNLSADNPIMSVYGVIYTYTGPLVNISVQRNIITNNTEVLATLIDGTRPAAVVVHAVTLETTIGFFV